MWGFASISIAFLALAVLAFADLHTPVAGLLPGEIASLLSFGALISSLLGIVHARISRSRPWRMSAAVALLIILIPVVLYMRRDDLAGYLDQYIGDVQPGRAVTNAENEVVVARVGDSSYILIGTINGYETRFLFDTGASTVVLMSETATALGIDVEKLIFSQPVYTANGRTLAAPYMIDTISVGSITEKNVRAMIAQKGSLSENLLGMTFMDRLSSYEVRGRRLILRK
jgi:clan AA aspartic protease, TIGR02281 family